MAVNGRQLADSMLVIIALGNAGRQFVNRQKFLILDGRVEKSPCSLAPTNGFIGDGEHLRQIIFGRLCVRFQGQLGYRLPQLSIGKRGEVLAPDLIQTGSSQSVRRSSCGINGPRNAIEPI